MFSSLFTKGNKNMLDLEQLEITGGLKKSSPSVSFGVGKQGGSKVWVETYSKIMNSKESISFYLVAAQEHLDYVTANNFAIATNFKILKSEEAVLNIIKPLSTENNEIYSKILNTLGLEASEKFGTKVKAFGRRVWTTIKEAFRKLRLAIINIIAAIRRWSASLGQGDASKIYEKKGEILEKVKKIGNKSISAIFPKQKCAFISKPGEFIESISKDLNITLQQTNKRLAAAKSGAKNGGRTEMDSMFAHFDKTVAASISKSFGNGAGNGWKNDKGGIIKRALYGQNPKKQNVKLSLLVTSDTLNVLAPNVGVNMKTSAGQLDVVVSNINKTITLIENHEKGNENTDKETLRSNLAELHAMRTYVMKVAIMSKDAYTEYFKIRGLILKAARMVLNGGGQTEAEYQKSQKKKQSDYSKNNSNANFGN